MTEPALSVIIPTLDEEEALPVAIARLRSVAAGAEVVVADGGSEDGTWGLRARFPDVRFLRARRGRGTQMNAGAAASCGRVLLFLHADTLAPPGCGSLVLQALDRPGTVGGSFCLRLEPATPLLRFYSWCSRIDHPLFTYGDQGLFLRRSTFQEIGGFAPIPLMEDVEIQGRLRRKGSFVKLAVPAVTSARRFHAHGILRQQLLNAVLVLAFHAGASPERLARWYGGRRESPASPSTRPFSRESPCPAPARSPICGRRPG